MALTVNTNMPSIDAVTNLNQTNRMLSVTIGRISSGLRINSAADDAAGLGVAESLDDQTRALLQAKRNANDGIALVQTAESAASEVADILKRMHELAVQSSSETLADSERAYIQDEYLALATEVDRIAAVTEFNGIFTSNGSFAGTLDVQVGSHNSANDRIGVTLGDLRAATLGVDSASVDLSTAATAQTAITDIETAIDSVSAYRSDFGAAQNRLESAITNLETYTQNLMAAESNIRDADFALETAEMSKLQIVQQAGVAVLAQANSLSMGALRLLG